MSAINNTFSDPILNELHRKVIAEFGELPPIIPAQPQNYFKQLCASIISQQLSTKVADVIEGRVTEALSSNWEPSYVLAFDATQLRAAGLSNAKVSYIKNIAEAWVSQVVTSEKIASESDEGVIEQLVTIKGVGRWTAEMFLIFTLGRPDVFSAGDYGLRKAIANSYNFNLKEKPQVFTALAENWKPQRSLASRVLWKSLELSK